MSKDDSGTFSADGSTDTYLADQNLRQYVIASGTFGGGTLVAQVSIDGSTWVNIGAPALLTAGGAFWFEVEAGMNYRLTLSGATSSAIAWAIY